MGVQTMKVFGKAFLLRALSSTDRLRYVLSQPGVHVAVCGADTQGQMEDNLRTVRNLGPMTPEEVADVRKRAVVGAGVRSGPALEYWKKHEPARAPGPAPRGGRCSSRSSMKRRKSAQSAGPACGRRGRRAAGGAAGGCHRLGRRN